MAIPVDRRYSVPDVVREMQDGLSHMRCYIVCPDHVADHVAAQRMKDAAANKVQTGIDWLIDAPELLIRENSELKAEVKKLAATIETDVAKAKSAAKKATDQVAKLKEDLETYKAKATAFEKLSLELQEASLTRPETKAIALMVCGILTGLRHMQFVSDEDDINRQTFCGLLLLCQRILKECGACADVALSAEQMHEILLSYYATLQDRDIDALKKQGHFFEAKPGPYGAYFTMVAGN